MNEVERLKQEIENLNHLHKERTVYVKQLKQQIDAQIELLFDFRTLTQELDFGLNGVEGAARQASLCDIVSQVRAHSDVLVPVLSKDPKHVKEITDMLTRALGTWEDPPAWMVAWHDALIGVPTAGVCHANG